MEVHASLRDAVFSGQRSYHYYMYLHLLVEKRNSNELGLELRRTIDNIPITAARPFFEEDELRAELVTTTSREESPDAHPMRSQTERETKRKTGYYAQR